MKMDLKINVFTLNCWGIVGISRHRKERMTAIASHIAASHYDFVFLQEVWSKQDFYMIAKKTEDVLPYSHYFFSGVTGSGVCILSRGEIVDVSQFQYSLNGFAHKILHGDWYGGKVVGLCKVLYHGLNINLYVTHLHAEYDRLHDQYLPHRVVQALEFSQFVKLTSETSDLTLVAGDFNIESQDIAYQLIVHNIGCFDSFTASQKSNDKNFICSTCGHPENLYTTKQELKDCPLGKRIDYIMYKCGRGTSVKCLAYETPVSKIPDSYLPYSDHEAVFSQLHIFKSANESPSETNCDNAAKMEALNCSLAVINGSINKLRKDRLVYFGVAVLCFVSLLLAMVFNLPSAYNILIEVVQIFCVILLVFCVWMATVMNRIEYNSLFSSSKSIEILMNSCVGDHGFQTYSDPENFSHLIMAGASTS